MKQNKFNIFSLWKLLPLILTFMFGSCSTTYNYQKDVANHYMLKDWQKYDVQLQQGYSGYQLIKQAQQQDDALTEVFIIHGKPDYVKAASKTRLNLAYLEKGVVLSFNLNSGIAPRVTPYQRFNRLSQYLVMLFKRAHKAHKTKSIKFPPTQLNLKSLEARH